jgi:cytochrome c peroxidase
LSTRNTLSLVNLRFAPTLTWIGQSITLEEQVLQPIGNHLEMGLDNLDHLSTKISKVDYYPALFEKAFESTEITHEKISRALAQFLRSMESSQSKFDQGFNNDWANFTALERMGKDLFESADNGCDNCHQSINFYYGSKTNIGLTMDYADKGAGNGKFRMPSLRNVALTEPYIHNG